MNVFLDDENFVNKAFKTFCAIVTHILKIFTSRVSFTKCKVSHRKKRNSLKFF